MDLTSEVADLKKQRNQDQEDVRLLKVEMVKLDQAFKKYKNTVPKGYSSLTLELPDFVKMLNVDGASTDEILIQVVKIRNVL